MADKITVTLASPDFEVPGHVTTDIELLDEVGPLNEWRPLTSGAFSIDGKLPMSWASGAKVVNCRGGGAVPLLVLNDFDLDAPAVDQKGSGSNYDSGDFPAGACKWRISAVE
jgi:hypothetical protein